jgi:hypothetical protein
VLAAVVAAGSVAGGSPASIPGIPVIYVNYDADCTFTMSVDGGTSVTATSAPGPTLPPGPYQLLVWMPNPNQGYACGTPTFSFAGPGVSIVTQFRGQELTDDRVTGSLPPSSTFVAEDTSAPVASERVFSTAATGSSSVLLGSASTGTTTKTSVQGDLVGSDVPPYRGRLVATVTAAGVPTLRVGSRKVATLRPGRYDIRVGDTAHGAGFYVRPPKGKPLKLTGGPFVGARTKQVTLTVGSWTFFSGVGKPTRFVVRAT